MTRVTLSRRELAGALGDLGTLLPLSIGMILINGLDPVAVYWGIGLFYIFSGLYFRLTMSVEPMKVVSGYAIATGIPAEQIQLAALLLGLILLVIRLSRIMGTIQRLVPRAIIRGLQLSTGLLLARQGVTLIAGTDHPALNMAAYWGPVPMSIIVGIGCTILTLALLANKRFPPALLIVGLGLVLGLITDGRNLTVLLVPVWTLPSFAGLPPISSSTIGLVMLTLVLPQLPMTVGNAIIATRDLAHRYFGENAHRVSADRLCLSMAVANTLCFFIGGMPMCHGAGGLASRYLFGARTAVSNYVIGALFIGLVVYFGENVVIALKLLPSAVLGVLLLFSGIQLGASISDVDERNELFIIILMVAITLAAGLGVAFICGLGAWYLMRALRTSF
jgi:SulP family sulfate permease